MTTEATNNERQGHILIVDTDSMSSELLVFRFDTEGFDTTIMTDAEKALKEDLTKYSVVLVDMMNQEFDGLKFTRAVKRNPDTFSVPVIVMTAKNTDDDVVDALDAGADDFVAKPYSTRELIARVRSVVRRRRMSTPRKVNKIVRFEDLVLDLGAGTAWLDGEQLQLTRTEYLILAMLMRNLNNFFERMEIRHEAWEDDNEVSDRAVDTNISRLRKKLGPYGRYIINRQGFGYGFVE